MVYEENTTIHPVLAERLALLRYRDAKLNTIDHTERWMIECNSPSQYKYKKDRAIEKINAEITRIRTLSRDHKCYFKDLSVKNVTLAYTYGISKEELCHIYCDDTVTDDDVTFYRKLNDAEKQRVFEKLLTVRSKKKKKNVKPRFQRPSEDDDDDIYLFTNRKKKPYKNEL